MTGPTALAPTIPGGPAQLTSMRAAVLRGVGDVVVEERPVPEAGPGQVVVRVASVGVCGSDTHYYEHGRIGRFVVDKPLVLGHEASGEVAAVGPGVTSQGLFLAKVCAAAVVVSLPVLIAGFAAQDKLVQGLSLGAVK